MRKMNARLAKQSEKMSQVFTLEHSKRTRSEKNFGQNRRTLHGF
jgi:hypothetical protein